MPARFTSARCRVPGGRAVLAGIGISVALGARDVWLPVAAAAVLAAVSFADDLRGLATSLSFAAHLGVAAALLWYFLAPADAMLIALLSVAVAWLTNLYNFMDGSDGLALGMSVFGFGTYSLAAWMAGDGAIATLCAATAAAAAAVLMYNFHPAKIFIGDVGSIPLGFLAGAIGVLGWRNDAWPLWFPLLVFAPFIADATITLARRALRREAVWRAHRQHYYQRCVRMGFGHARTALGAYVLMLVCAAAALYGRGQPPAQQATAVLCAMLVLGLTAEWLDMRWARHTRAEGAPT